jgi:hypothetical protein
MIEHKFTYLKFFGLAMLSIMAFTSCEREISDAAVPATFPTTADVYTDNPVGLTDEFFESFDPAFGANTEAFGTDDNEAYLGTSSIRLDIPAPDDPNGGFIGGIFRDRGEGRDLSGYDALTFWIKASRTATFDAIGFGADFDQERFVTTRSNIPLSTDWRKVIIPIPEPSKLTQERGLFSFSTGTQSTNGVGFTVWIDEIRYENLGTVAQPRPRILGGQDQNAQANINTEIPIIGLSQTFSTTQGDITVSAAPAYYEFTSSNDSIAVVNESGIVTVVGSGQENPVTGEIENNTAQITATIGDVQAEGSLTVEAVDLDILSIFSDVYANVPVDNYNGFYNGDGQTTEGGAPPVNEDGNNVIVYTQLNFVAIEFYGRDGSNVEPKDLTEFEFFHIDIRVDQPLVGGETFTIELFNNFATANQTSGAITLNASDLQSGNFVSFDIPLDDFPGLSVRDAVGAIIFSSGGITNVSLDNIYFYAEN